MPTAKFGLHKIAYLRAQLKDQVQSAFFFELVDNNLRINVTSRLFVKNANPSDGFSQVRNQLGTPGGAKSFLRGAQIFKLCPIRPVTSMGHQGWQRVFWKGPKFFKLCPIVFNYAQQIFPGGAKRFAVKASPPSPLVTGLCPIVLSMSTHFPGGPTFFLGSYGHGFAPKCCVGSLATVENERSFVAVVTGNVANKCNSVRMFEKKTQLECLCKV